MSSYGLPQQQPRPPMPPRRPRKTSMVRAPRGQGASPSGGPQRAKVVAALRARLGFAAD